MSTTVCSNQDDFNQSFRQGVKYFQKQEEPKKWAQIPFVIIYTVLIIWALLLAMKVQTNRQFHTLLALLFAPIYVIAHYLDKSQQ